MLIDRDFHNVINIITSYIHHTNRKCWPARTSLVYSRHSSDILLTFPEPLTPSPPSQQSYPSVCNTVAYPSGAGLNSIIQIFGNSESLLPIYWFGIHPPYCNFNPWSNEYRSFLSDSYDTFVAWDLTVCVWNRFQLISLLFFLAKGFYNLGPLVSWRLGYQLFFALFYVWLWLLYVIESIYYL